MRAQLLTLPRPTDLLETVRHLTLVQLEPTRPVAPSADLVLWSRLGATYDVRDLRDALDEQRLVELDGLARPADDIALFRAEMDAWPGPEPRKEWQDGLLAWVEANNACRLDVLDRLRGDGPLPASAAAGHLRGAVALQRLEQQPQRAHDARPARRSGRGRGGGTGGPREALGPRRADLPRRPTVPLAEALRARDVRRLAALGIARAGKRVVPIEPIDVGEAGVTVTVEGVKGRWQVDPDQLAALDEPFAGRAALLSPFDRLLADRKRTTELFEFDYVLEMYKPEAQRRWGYYALPVLHGDRLVGKLDARADREAGVLRVTALHEDEPFDTDTRDAVDAEVAALAEWLGLALELPA